MTLSLSENSLKILERRYLAKNEKRELIETPEEMFRRVASNIASAEALYGGDVAKMETEFYEIMTTFKFLPNSPTLMNAGKPELQQLSACFVLPIDDSIESIFDAVKYTALIHKSGGGTGFSFSRLRPKNDVVRTTGGIASGPISFMKVLNTSTEVIKQGGRRRGANMSILRVDHPDIIEFITSKRDLTELTNFNISVAVTDEFMKAVKTDRKYDLINPRTKQVVETLDAKDVFNLIVEMAWTNGEPGLFFIDRANQFNPTPALGDYESTNPCGEQLLLPMESCNLGSINLAKMVKQENGQCVVDYEEMKRVVRLSVRFLDNVIDMNNFPLPEIEKMTKENRKIGLGVMGWADLLIQMKIPYDSLEALELAEKTMKFITEEGRKASEDLAKERITFPSFENSIYGGSTPLRNATITTIAPTGTISMIADCSSGIEPLFAVSYFKKVMDGEKLVTVNPYFERIAKEEGIYGQELMQKIAEQGTIQKIDEIPEHIRRIFITAHDISPEWHVRMQAAFQKHTDNAVSKCLHGDTLMPTNRGLIPIKNCGEASGIDTFGPSLPDLRVTTGNGGVLHKILSHYSAGSVPAVEVRLRNGSSMIGARDTHRILTPDGWKTLGDLRKDDLVFVRHRFNPIHTEGGKPIQFDYKFRASARKIPIPKKMNEELALWLGMLAADGSLIESSGAVRLHEKNKSVGYQFDILTKSIFGETPKKRIDKRTGVVSHLITSRVLVRFAQNLIGKRARSKHVPRQILEGSREEKLAFVRGITLDGYLNEGRGLVIYYGTSKLLAYELAEILRSFGLPLIYQGRKHVKGYGMAYSVEVSNELQGIIEPLEEHKRTQPHFKKYFVLIDAEEVKSLRLPFDDTRYSNLRWLKQSGRYYCWNTVAESLGLNVISAVEKVTSVEEVGDLPLYDVEVDEAHNYLVNGMVSHNTVNMPQDATKADVATVFMTAYELGCKGVTVFRYGSREAVVNIGKVEVEETPSKDVLAPRTRPSVTTGETERIRTGCGNLYVTINQDSRGLFEVFSTLGHSGGCPSAQSEAISRLISLTLRSGVKIESVIKQLAEIRCPSSSWDEGTLILSCPDAIGKALSRYIERHGIEDSDEKLVMKSYFGICPDCGGQLVHEEGCLICKSCGASKCE